MTPLPVPAWDTDALRDAIAHGVLLFHGREDSDSASDKALAYGTADIMLHTLRTSPAGLQAARDNGAAWLRWAAHGVPLEVYAYLHERADSLAASLAAPPTTPTEETQ